MQTAISEKFRRAGVVPRDVIFERAIALYLNNGGTIQEAKAILDRVAERMGGEGHRPCSREGHKALSNAVQPNDGDEGHRACFEKNISRVPSSPSQNSSAGQMLSAVEALPHVPAAATKRDGAGQSGIVDQTSLIVPRPVSTGYIRAAKVASIEVARTVLDSYKVRDGRAIGDVSYGELRQLAKQNKMEAALCDMIEKHGVPPSQTTKIRLFISAERLERMIQKAAEVADAA